jgi:hypothetical protein
MPIPHFAANHARAPSARPADEASSVNRTGFRIGATAVDSATQIGLDQRMLAREGTSHSRYPMTEPSVVDTDTGTGRASGDRTTVLVGIAVIAWPPSVEESLHSHVGALAFAGDDDGGRLGIDGR